MGWKAQNNFSGGEISPVLFGRVEIEQYKTSVSLLQNFKVMPHGGATRRTGTLFSVETKDSSKRTRLIKFEYNDDISYLIEAGDQYFRFISYGEPLLTGFMVEMVTPYLEEHLSGLKFTQIADVLWITHKLYAPRRLERTNPTTWELLPVTFIDGAYLGLNATGTTMDSDAEVGTATVTASSIIGINHGLGFTAGDIGRLIRIFDEDGQDHTWGWGDITAVNSDTEIEVNIVDGSFPRTPTTIWKLGKWTDNPDAELGFPACCTLHEQRMVYGGTPGVLQDIDLSQTDRTAFFGQTLDEAIVDSDAIGLRLTSGNLNAVRWVESIDKGLAVATSGGIWLVTGAGGTDDPITPLSFSVKRKVAEGVADVQGMAIGNAMVYLSRNGKSLHEFAYVFEDDGYDAPDLSILAEHLTKEHGIIAFDYQDDEKILWCVREDGILLGFTYMRKQGVVAWHQHDLGGDVEDVSCIKEGGKTITYLLVRRFIDGQYRRFIEYMPEEFYSEETADAYFVDCGVNHNRPVAISGASNTNPVVITAEGHGFIDGDTVTLSDIEGMTGLNGLSTVVTNSTPDTFELGIDATGFDIYKSGGVARETIIIITGLDHLEGETVDLLTDGMVIKDETVVSGQVVLPKPASRVVCGLPFNSNLWTLPLENQQIEGDSSIGRQKSIGKVSIRVSSSYACKAGRTEDLLDEVEFNEEMVVGVAPDLFTGDVDVYPDGAETEVSTDVRVYLRQDVPLPLMITALVYDYKLHEESEE